MERTLSSGLGGSAGLILAVFAGLPAAMIAFDGLTLAHPNDAIWSMPLPVVAALLTMIGAVTASGAFRVPLVPDRTGQILLRAALGLGAVAVALTLLRATNPLYGLIKLSELGLAAGVALALSAAFRTAPPDFARAAALAFVFGVAAALPLAALARTSGWPAGYGTLDMPGFIHIRIFGFSLALSLAAAAGLWGAGSARERLALFMAMVALSTALFWSGGRGALAALVLPLPVLALLLPALRPGGLALSAALLAGAALAWFLPGEVAELGLGARMAETGFGASTEELSSGRMSMWRILIEQIAEAPVLGHGAAQTHWIFADAGLPVAHLHAHNLVLDTALALGWPGAALAGALVAWGWFRGLALARRTGTALHAAGLCLVSVFLALAMVDGAYVYWQGLLPLALGVALLMQRPEDDRDRANRRAV